MNNEVVFSHRPVAGISAGAWSDGSRLIVAFALVNDGSSRNGIVWADRMDSFSRSVARSIIGGRIEDWQNGGSSDFVVAFDTNMSARAFMADFRRAFKPCLDETDDLFVDVLDFGEGMEVRARMRADSIISVATSLANGVVAGVNSVS